jgi:hypothetical protein
MTEIFSFNHWFNSLSLSENIHNDFKSAMLDMVTNKDNFSNYTTSFTTSHNLIVNNLGFIEKDENHKYFVDIIIPRVGDITTCFNGCPYDMSINSPSDVKMDLLLGGIKAPIQYGTKLVNASAMYTEIKIRITFENEPFSVSFKYKNYLLLPELRQYLIKKNFIQDGIKYSDGVAVDHIYELL